MLDSNGSELKEIFLLKTHCYEKSLLIGQLRNYIINTVSEKCV